MEVGDQIRVSENGGAFPRLAIVLDVMDRDWCEIEVQPILHVDETGTVWESGSKVWWDREKIVLEPGDPVAPHAVQVTRYIEQDSTMGELLSHKIRKGATIHIPGDEGQPICGATLRGFKLKPKRWDAWNNRWCNPREETSVWLPSFQDVTCKRCLTKQAKGE